MMKHSSLVLFGMVACIILSGMGTASAAETPLSRSDRQCLQNGDCTLIVLHCNCNSMSCYKEAELDALNKLRFEQFKYLENCTDAELESCAESGACPSASQPFAICQNQQCVVTWQPNPILK